ncbi:MAG: hypothetical protein ACOX56_05955 [Acholeplasmataceae bacterium]|jgi:hypothetical protein
MYHFIEDKEFLGRMRKLCSDIVNQLVQEINKDDFLNVKAYLVGSGARNLITQNANNPIDLDYNLDVIESKCDINNGKEIKDYVQKVFNEVLNRNNWEDCQDSTSALTTNKMHFTKGNQTSFSIDLAITKRDGSGNLYRLIHKKTGIVFHDEWYWNEIPKSKGLDKRIKWLKDNNKWGELRETYLDKKNMYLKGNDYDHPSFICYIEAVNEVYYKYN